ncbi:unnamed protein product [Prunus armeniaca]|uniref:Uncharacterized protein n=1 Tax=Prunus armeniaca TaxID=36596 RepID=A0A6J5VG41_PRUAR|nr:unnamed protein product [Prunus armeniaca]
MADGLKRKTRYIKTSLLVKLEISSFPLQPIIHSQTCQCNVGRRCLLAKRLGKPALDIIAAYGVLQGFWNGVYTV